VRLVRTERGRGTLAAGGTAGRRRPLWAQLAGPAAVAVALAASVLVTAPAAGALADGAKAAAVRLIPAASLGAVSRAKTPATTGGGAIPGTPRLNATNGAGTSARRAGDTPSAASGGTWGPISELPGWSGGQASSVSCADASDCTAVGSDGADGSAIATKTDGIWAPAVDDDNYAPSLNLYGVSCPDAADCTAVGGDYEGCDLCNAAVYLTETAGTWGEPTDSHASEPAYFSGVSCTGATDCTAVGEDGNDQPFYQTETGGTWGTPTQISASGSFSGVSCTSATDCTAVGQGGFYATETDGTWGPATGISGTTSVSLSGVSCTDATDCTAVGQDGNDQPIYATESAGTWGPATEITVPSSLGGSGSFSGVSCTSATDCTAVGEDGNDQPFYAAETGGNWGTPTEITIPSSAGSRGFFTSVSCTSITDCTAVGQVPDGAEFYATESAGQPSQTTITSTTASPVTGQPVSIAVQVAGTSPGAGVPAPSGDVVVTDGTHSCQAALSGSNGVSTGSCSLTEDSAGGYSITAGYPGDANFGSSQTSSATAVTVGPAPSATTITSATAGPVTGQPVTIAVQVAGKYPGAGVAAPSGTVTVTDGTRTCQASLSGSNGTATGSCQITEDAAGSYSLTASYPGDSNFGASTTSPATTLTVGPAPSKTTITSATSSVAGQPITVEVRTAGEYTGSGIVAPSGTVTVTGGTGSCRAALSGSGGVSTGSCQLTEASSGSYTLTAGYPGDANFGSSTSPAFPVTVAKATTKTGLTLSAATVTFGNDKTLKLTATVTPQYTGTPAGTVTITAGTATLCVAKLSAGTGSCTPASATSLGAGSHTLTAAYSGDSNFDSSTAAKTVKITKATTTTGLTLSAATVTFGNDKTLKLTATVTPQYSGTPAGTVTITAGTITLCVAKLSAGTGSCTPASATSLGTGSHTLTASYSGDSNFDSSAAAKTVKITKATTKTSLTLSAATVTDGKEKALVMSVTVAPQYSGTPGGQVIIASGPTTLCIVTLSGGTGKCSPPTQTSLSPGKHTVVAAYQGNADFTTSSASKPLTVNKA
jgi:large repetitive protein